MRTEEEFEQYVADLGRKGVMKRKRIQRIIASSASVLVVCFASLLIIHTIRNTGSGGMMPSPGINSPEMEAHDQRPQNGMVKPTAGMNAAPEEAPQATERVTEVYDAPVSSPYEIDITRDKVVTGLYITMEQYKELMNWYDITAEHAKDAGNILEDISEPDDSDHCVLLADEVEQFVYYFDGYLWMEHQAYEVTGEDREAFLNILRVVR